MAHRRRMRKPRPIRAATKYGMSRQRYHHCSHNSKKGASSPSRARNAAPSQLRQDRRGRTPGIRHRFLDPDASADVIAQKLRQAGIEISTRSVERVIEKYGLQKKNSIAIALVLSPLWKRRPQDTHQTRALRPAQYRIWSATNPGRQGHGEPVRRVAAGSRILRLGAWELVCGWTGQRPEQVQAAAGFAAHPRGGPLYHRPALRRGLNTHL